MSTKPAAKKTKNNLKCSTSHLMFNEVSLKSKPSDGSVVSSVKVFVSLGKLAKKRGSNTPNHGQGLFESNQILQFHILHSTRSHLYLKVISGWIYTTFMVCLRHYANLEKNPPSVLISIYRFAYFSFLNI